MTSQEVVQMLDDLKNVIYPHDAPVMLEEGFRLQPASHQDLAAFEAQLGEDLPEDYRTFLLENTIRHNFMGNFACLSLPQIIRIWENMGQLLDEGAFADGRIQWHLDQGFGNWADGRIKQVWWSRAWVPVSEDSCGNLKCIDLDPGPRGKKYQMLQMEIQDGQGPYSFGFSSFTSYLRYYLDSLIMGDFRVESGGIELTE
jgi:cell wall assembly regulator SMI1